MFHQLLETLSAIIFLCFRMTRERVATSKKENSVSSDLGFLFRNAPWWILLGSVLCFNLFSASRYTVGPFFFASIIGEGAQLRLFSLEFMFYAGIFFAVGEIANMLGVSLAPWITGKLGKKTTFISCLTGMSVLSICFYFVPVTGGGYWGMLLLQILISILTGVGSPLIWSMYADVADYAEYRFDTSSTGLVFSSSSMAQKFGGAFGGAAVMWMLAGFGYDTTAGAVQTETAIMGLRVLMSWIPAAVAALAIIVTFFYPLTKKKMESVQAELAAKRAER